MLCAWSCEVRSDLIKRTLCTLGQHAASGCVHGPDPIELNMNRDAGFASPAQLHLGCSGVAGGIPGATETVGQCRPQRSLCCRRISAADPAAVLAADAYPSALLSTPCSGQCAVLELLQHSITFTSCWVMAALAC